MKRRIPSWMAIAAGGVLAAASAFAQGDNPRPSGDAAGSAHPSTATSSAGTSAAGAHDGMQHGAKHAKGKAGKHAKGKMKSNKTAAGASTSGSGTASAAGMRGEMSRCTSMTDRSQRAECARTAWEREHGTSG